MLVVDLMHEFELGVWKGLFTHLVRLLMAIDTSLVVEMDRRCGCIYVSYCIVSLIRFFKVPTNSSLRSGDDAEVFGKRF
jgi:hypothetical protein